jgi:hypothetical protein
MENTKELEAFLQSKLSLDATDLKDPDLSLVNEARKKVMLRKKSVQKPWVFISALAFVFDLKIKFVQLGLATFIIAMCIFYINDQPGSCKNQVSSNNIATNTHSLLNSPTLTCIQTTAAPEH